MVTSDRFGLGVCVVTARSELRKVLFLAPSVCGVFFRVRNISGTAERICAKFTRKTCLVPRWDEFEGQGQRSRSQRTKKRHFSAISVACVWFVW